MKIAARKFSWKLKTYKDLCGLRKSIIRYAAMQFGRHAYSTIRTSNGASCEPVRAHFVRCRGCSGPANWSAITRSSLRKVLFDLLLETDQGGAVVIGPSAVSEGDHEMYADAHRAGYVLYTRAPTK